MTKMRIVPAILFAAALSCSFASHAQTATPQQLLQQYVSGLQKNPNDTALREKIIKHVGMKRGTLPFMKFLCEALEVPY